MIRWTDSAEASGTKPPVKYNRMNSLLFYFTTKWSELFSVICRKSKLVLVYNNYLRAKVEFEHEKDRVDRENERRRDKLKTRQNKIKRS